MFPRADLHASFTDAECGSLDYPGAFRSNLLGDDRRLDETADNMIREGAVEPLIVVGVYL